MTDSTTPWSQRPRAIFWMVTSVAFVLRLIHIWQMSDPALNPAFFAPITDAGVHHRWAQQILLGTWPGPEPFFRAPLYPYFLSALYFIFGSENPLPVQLVHGFVSALGAGLAALCAHKLWDWRAAWSAGLLFSTLWSSIYFSAELLGVTLSVTLNLWLLYLVLGASNNRAFFFCGGVLGLSAITQPTVLVITPVLVWFFSQRKLLRSGWKWLVLGLVVSIGPVSLRNLSQGGEPVMIAASGGVNFYIGNNEFADGRVAFLPGAPITWQGEMSDVKQLAAAESGHAMSAQASDRYFWRQGLQFWRDQPDAAAKLMARKAWLLVAGSERSNNKNLAFWRARSPLLRWPVWPGWAFILGLATVGFLRSDLAVAKRWLLLGLVILYGAALLLFFINVRFRLPILAWLVIPAGGGLAAVFSLLKSRATTVIPRYVVPTGLAIAILSFVPDALTYQQNPEFDFESWRSLGNSYFSGGDEERAVTTWRTALAIDEQEPQPAHRWTLPQIYQPLIQLYTQRGQMLAALAVQKLWVARLPESSQARLGLANMLLQSGDASGAIEQLNLVVAQSPENTEAQLGLAWSYYQDEQYDTALAKFRHLAAGSTATNADYGIGLSLLALGEYDSAEIQLKKLVAASPGFWQAYENLATLYGKTGRPTEELRCWTKVLASQPQHRRARERVAQLRP